eukprot:g5394.t1
MVQIPHALMMSDFHAKADPDFGHVHRNSRILDSDNGLAIYIMQEILKEEKSFYWPYLRVLPTPHNLRSWSGEDLLLLQDTKLADRYTFELFDFAWSTVQARAFGKRLKSSALVPFADCLNHGNVQTKYDFDVEGNGMFRLFPSGSNRYPRRAEVLNSYGRRANDNLLLDYGFAMLDNEWDTAEVVCALSPCDHTLERRRKTYLRSSGQNAVRILRVRRDVWDPELMRFCRCACLTAPELDKLDAAAKQELEMTQEAIARAQGFVQKASESFVEKDYKGDQLSVVGVHAPPSSSRLNHVLSSPSLEKSTTPSSGGVHHHRCESNNSTSFASYLSEVDVLLLQGPPEQQRSPPP